MERIACIDVPQLSLQLWAREQSLEAGAPLGMVAAERVHSPLLEVNAAAWRQGVRVGMRYGAALSVCPQLRVGLMREEALEMQRQRIAERLNQYSPLVERNASWPDSFWLRAKGLSGLWRSASAWAQAMHTELTLQGLLVSVVVGYSRFFSFAVARQAPGELRVFRDAAGERQAAEHVRLSVLALPQGVREEFERLGVETVGALRVLPTGAVHRRYGAEAASLLRLVREERGLETQTVQRIRRYEEAQEWEQAVQQSTALLFLLQAPIEKLCAAVERDALSCERVALTLRFDWPKYIDERLARRAAAAEVAPHESLRFELRAAQPHTEPSRWVTLLRLHLEKLVLPIGVCRVELEATPVHLSTPQESLPTRGRRLHPDALLEELSKLQAVFGADAVGRLRAQPAHLPEARQGWSALRGLNAPQPHPHFRPTLLRRMHDTAKPLPASVRGSAPWTWLPLHANQGRRVRMVGPYTITGAWWHREVERAYYYVHLQRGDVLWVYYDRPRDRWFLQGHVY